MYHLPFVMSWRASLILRPRYLEYSESKYSGREFLHFWRGDGETVGLKNLVKLIWTFKIGIWCFFFYVFSFSIPTSTLEIRRIPQYFLSSNFLVPPSISIFQQLAGFGLIAMLKKISQPLFCKVLNRIKENLEHLLTHASLVTAPLGGTNNSI